MAERITGHTELIGLMAVSYTQLDVYKRQAYTPWISGI